MTTPLSSPKPHRTDLHRVGILFSGGPAPAANAVIGSAASCFSRAGIEVLGLHNGYTHLIDFEQGDKIKEGIAYTVLDHRKLEGRRTEQGIMIGTARANPGKSVQVPKDFNDPKATAQLHKVYNALRSLDVGALISIGGDDTLTTAAKFKLFQDQLPANEPRVRVVHLPKTIDNDYEGIDFTFGYFTAVDMLATQVRNLLADGQAAKAWYICQVMGRKAGWLSYGASIAGEGSLVIGLEDIAPHWWSEEVTKSPQTGKPVLDERGKPLLRKIFDVPALVDRMTKTVIARLEEGKAHGVILMAEGLGEYLPLEEIHKCISEDEYRSLKPDSFGHFPVSQMKFTSRIGRLVKEQVKEQVGQKIKTTGLQFGYEVRCNSPTAFDVVLGSQLGVGAYRALVEENKNGVMVSTTGQLELLYEDFEDLIDFQKLRAHPRPILPGEAFHQLARYLEVRVDD